MTLEIETKLRVDDLDSVRQQLMRLGAAHHENIIETDTLFDRPDGSLRARGIALRLRQVVNAVDRAPVRTVLTVKGPVLAGSVKTREELELQIAIADVMARMLNQLGFHADLTYQKRRDVWKLSDCSVCLDEPAYIGSYVEIEGPDERRVLAAQAELGLADYPYIRPSYAAMMAAYCEANSLQDRRVMLP